MDPSTFASLLVYANEALSRYAVEELVSLWKLSTVFAGQGLVLRTLLNNNVSVLAAHHRISVAEDTSFADFVNAYERTTFNRICEESLEKCLEEGISEGKMWKVKRALDRGASDRGALLQAVKAGQANMVAFFLQRGKTDLSGRALLQAAEDNNQEIIELLLKTNNDPGYLDYGLAGAAKAGNLELINYFLGLGATNLEYAIVNAVSKKQKEVVDFLFEKDNNPDLKVVALSFAAERDNREMIDYVLSRDDWLFTLSLSVAVEKGNKDLVRFLLEKGIPMSREEIEQLIHMANAPGNQEMVGLLEAYQARNELLS